MKKLLAFSLVALAACGSRDTQQSDSAFARELALASQLATAQPTIEFQDSAPAAEPAPASTRPPAPQRRPSTRITEAPRVRVLPRQPVAPQPVTPEPQPVVVEPVRQPAEEPARQPARAMIGAGATFSLASTQRICSSTNLPGDRFVATVTNTVTGSNGAVIPAGSSVVLQVASISDEAIGFSVHSVDLSGRNYPVVGDVHSTGELERVRTNAASDRKKVAGGAIAGALIGQIMKKNTKGTVIGAAAGAATGAVAAKMTERYTSCLPVGASLTMTLGSALAM